MNINGANRQTKVFVFISLIWLIYFWLRALYVPITFDEAATFFHFVQRGDFWFYSAIPDANNHFINSLFSFFSIKIFGVSKLSLRLPNLISAIVFLYYLYRCSSIIKNGLLRWSFIISLMFTHYFVEFFAVSRGYGLSMAFLMGVFYYLVTFINHKSRRSLILISVFLVLAELSNLSILVLALATIGYQIIYILTKKAIIKKERYVLLLIILIFQILPTIFSSNYMFYLQEKGSLYYGDGSGLWTLTVKSLIFLVTGTNTTVYSTFTIILFIYLMVAVVLVIIKEGFKEVFNPLLIFPVLLFTSITGILLLSTIFKINYPEDRVAMYFIPLFICAIPTTTYKLFGLSKRNYIMFVLIPLLFFPAHFVYSLNFKYVNGYKTEVLPERYYHTIANDPDNNGEFPATIGGYRMRMFCWAFMNYVNGGSQNLLDYQSYPETQSDYQIVDIDENPEWLEHYDIIDSEGTMNRKLLKRKKKIVSYPIKKYTISNPPVSNREFYRLIDIKADSIINSSCLITFNLDLNSPESPFYAWVVVQYNDDQGNNILYKSIPVNWLRSKWGGTHTRFVHSILTGVVPEDASQMIVYVWNINKDEYSIIDGEIIINKIDIEAGS